ncbi:MAG: hypothetical protein EXX96DRAFT_558198 [Benjaminiella poitrasii]|nr:MAG: hypothetical protein EXX96DRAFT_558198 [Benjaminiella poitrasii]
MVAFKTIFLLRYVYKYVIIILTKRAYKYFRYTVFAWRWVMLVVLYTCALFCLYNNLCKI